MAKPRGRPRQFDSQAALNKAMLVFWEQGFSATSLDDLGVAMGMNRPSIYNAFGSKEQIYREALAQFSGKLDVGIANSLVKESSLKKALTSFFDQALDVYCANDPARGCFVMCTAPADALTHPDVKRDLGDLISRLDQKLEQRIKQAIKAGELPAAINPRLMAMSIQATLHSLALRARAGESKPTLKKFARHAVQILPIGYG